MSKKTLGYVAKLVINGQEVSQKAKSVSCTINKQEVNLNCTYVNDFEIEQAYKSHFEVKAGNKNIEVHYAKVDNRVSATVYIDSILAFSSLSIQAVFTVVNSAYGISKSTLNNLYVKSNATRKQASKSTSNVVVSNTFEF